MNPDSVNFYNHLYESLGRDFHEHLDAGNLHLYTMVNENRSIKGEDSSEMREKGWFEGRVLSPIFKDSTAASIETAKTMILDKLRTIDPLTLSPKDPRITHATNSEEVEKINALYQIVKISAEKNPLLPEHFANYGIENGAARFEIAKIASFRYPQKVTEFITNFNLTNEQRFEIAKMLIKTPDPNFTEIIRNFSLTDEQNFEFLKVVCEHHPQKIIELISHFDLTNIQRLEIAQIAAKRFGKEMPKLIASFRLDPQGRFEIAKILAADFPYQISEKIDQLDLDSEQRFEIAKIAAKKSGRDLTEHLEKYSLTPSQHFEVAKIAIQQNAWDVICSLTRYNLTPEQLYELAKMTAVKEPQTLINSLSFFNLTEFERFDLAKTIAAIDGSLVSSLITNFKLKNPIFRFEVAKIAAAQNGFPVSFHIFSLGLNPFQRFEVAKIALLQNPVSYTHLSNYELMVSDGLMLAKSVIRGLFEKNENARELSALFCNILLYTKFYHDLDEIHPFLERLTDKDVKKYANDEIDLFEQFPGIHLFTAKDLSKIEIQRLLSNNQYFEVLSPVIDLIFKNENPEVRKPLLQSLGKLLLNCQIQNVTPQDISKGLPMIMEIFTMRDYELSLSLIKNIVKTIKNENILTKWLELFKSANKPYTANMCMLLAPLIMNEDMLQISSIIKVRYFQDSIVRKPFLKNLDTILNNDKYLESEKISILKSILEPPLHSKFLESKTEIPTLKPEMFVKRAEKVAFIMSFDQEKALLNVKSDKDLNSLVNDIFRIYLHLEHIENISEKFQNTFGSSQHPGSIFRYAATLQKLPEYERDDYMNVFREFTESVIEGTYPSVRYTTENNQHLQAIIETDGGQKLIEGWQLGAVYNDLFNQEISKEPKKISPIALFHNGMMDYQYFPKTVYLDLLTVLLNPNALIDAKKNLEQERPEIKLEKKISLEELSAIKLMLPDLPLSDDIIDSEVNELIENLKALNQGLSPDKISPIKLEIIQKMFPDNTSLLKLNVEQIEAKRDLFKSALKRENELKIKKINSFQLQVINLMYPESALSTEEIATKLKSIKETLLKVYVQNPKLPLIQDIERLIRDCHEMSETHSNPFAGWTVCDTDDPYSILLSGKVIPLGTCQDIDADPRTSKNLLAYLIDGKNRMIVVNDPNGNMKARAIIRLMWDPVKQKPALFLENIYKDVSVPEKATEALIAAAKRRSQELGLELYSMSITELSEGTTLSSLDGRALTEFVDAVHDERGKVWDINEAYKLA